jgi:hypothetical protein
MVLGRGNNETRIDRRIMKLTFNVEEALEDISGGNGLWKRTLKAMKEQNLEAEMTDHLG